MPIASCDPTQRGQGEIHNFVTLQSGPVYADIVWDWDGVSAWGACNGPLLSARLRNTGTVPWYIRLPRKKQGNKWFQIDPGTDVMFTPQQLSQAGLDSYVDVWGVQLAATPGG